MPLHCYLCLVPALYASTTALERRESLGPLCFGPYPQPKRRRCVCYRVHSPGTLVLLTGYTIFRIRGNGVSRCRLMYQEYKPEWKHIFLLPVGQKVCDVNCLCSNCLKRRHMLMKRSLGQIVRKDLVSYFVNTFSFNWDTFIWFLQAICSR